MIQVEAELSGRAGLIALSTLFVSGARAVMNEF